MVLNYTARDAWNMHLNMLYASAKDKPSETLRAEMEDAQLHIEAHDRKSFFRRIIGRPKLIEALETYNVNRIVLQERSPGAELSDVVAQSA